jgi:hypothetical protein
MTTNREEIDRHLHTASQSLRNTIAVLETNVEPSLIDTEEKNKIRTKIGRLKEIWVELGSEFEGWK